MSAPLSTTHAAIFVGAEGALTFQTMPYTPAPPVIVSGVSEGETGEYTLTLSKGCNILNVQCTLGHATHASELGQMLVTGKSSTGLILTHAVPSFADDAIVWDAASLPEGTALYLTLHVLSW